MSRCCGCYHVGCLLPFFFLGLPIKYVACMKYRKRMKLSYLFPLSSPNLKLSDACSWSLILRSGTSHKNNEDHTPLPWASSVDLLLLMFLFCASLLPGLSLRIQLIITFIHCSHTSLCSLNLFGILFSSVLRLHQWFLLGWIIRGFG